MTTRSLWQSIMHYGSFDRMPVLHWAPWEETRRCWQQEGLPVGVNEHEFFQADPPFAWFQLNMELFPPLAGEVLEETQDYRVVRNGGGVIQKEWKGRSCIPQFLGFTLRSAKDWDDFKRRLQPDPARIPPDIDARIALAESWGQPTLVPGASLMGWIRNWMGVENMSYLMYDDPDVYADMVDTLAELTCWACDELIPRYKSRPDLGYHWEDICFRNGPLVSPDIFRRCVAPGYRKIRRKLESYDIHILGIDCDGFIEPLLPEWLDAGVNLYFPLEIGVWGADPMDLRRKFGREMRMVGGINKLALAKGREAIDAEIERRIPIMKEGGFIPLPDHLIQPGVPLADYQYYLERIRELRF